MPRPRGKGKPKSKPKASESPGPTQPDSFVGDIDNVEGWSVIISMFCKHLELPDLTTINGLKKVHRDFDSICRRLDRLYKNNSANEKIVGGVIGIYAKMCADSILRDKLFKAGVLSRLMPLLNMPLCRKLALRALSSVAHYGCIEVKVEIARQTTVLVDLIREHPQDPQITELALPTLLHAADAATGDLDKHPNAKLVKALDIPMILKFFIEALRRPHPSAHLIDHAIKFFAGAALHCYEECNAYPPVVTFMIAGLRSRDLTVRCTCLGALIRLHHHESEAEPKQYDPYKTIAAAKDGYPTHLANILVDYGVERGDVVITLETTIEHQRVFNQCAQDHDLYALGRSLAQFIMRTEFSVSKGSFQAENPHTGALETTEIGLPFVWWDDALPHCAKAIRDKKEPGEEDAADILDVKYFIAKGRLEDGIAHAKRAIARNPDHAYFYYAIALGSNGTDGLRAAKKGLKCNITSPFVHFALLQRAVDHAGDMGIRLLQAGVVGGKEWKEGVAFLTSAMDDAKTFINGAPPDTRHMKTILYWYILLNLTIRGSAISQDLRELQNALTMLRVADDFSYFAGNDPPKTELRMALKTVITLYSTASGEWSDVIARFDNLRTQKEPPISPEKAEDDLAAWLENLHEDNGELKIQAEAPPHPVFDNDHVVLFRCSWCGCPSAILRKCGGCHEARYCFRECQVRDWRTHKVVCGVTVDLAPADR